jgi:hypothetical protein
MATLHDGEQVFLRLPNNMLVVECKDCKMELQVAAGILAIPFKRLPVEPDQEVVFTFTKNSGDNKSYILEVLAESAPDDRFEGLACYYQSTTGKPSSHMQGYMPADQPGTYYIVCRAGDERQYVSTRVIVASEHGEYVWVQA